MLSLSQVLMDQPLDWMISQRSLEGKKKKPQLPVSMEQRDLYFR